MQGPKLREFRAIAIYESKLTNFRQAEKIRQDGLAPLFSFGRSGEARRDSCPSPDRPAATTDHCCQETTRTRAPHRPAIRHCHPRAKPQGRLRSSPRLPTAADRTPVVALVAEGLRANGSEIALRCRLYRHEPTQRSQAGFDIGGYSGRNPRNDQGLRQTRVVVSEPVFKPHPVLCFNQRHDGNQLLSNENSDTLG